MRQKLGSSFLWAGLRIPGLALLFACQCSDDASPDATHPQCGNALCETGEDGESCARDCCVSGDARCRSGCTLGNDDDCEATPKVETSCTDGQDNDGDGLADGLDGDCWSRDGAVYETHPYYYSENGRLSDVTAAVPAIAELGVKTIYLMPIFRSLDSPQHCHAIYNALDQNEIDPRFGTDADLRALVDTVHAHGMRIILDIVTRLTPMGSVIDSHTSWMMNMRLSALESVAAERSWNLGYTACEGKNIICDCTPGTRLVFSGCSAQLLLGCRLLGLIRGAEEDVIFATWSPVWGLPKGCAPDNANAELIEYHTAMASSYVKDFDIDGWRIDTPFRNWNPDLFPGDHSVLPLFRSVTSAIRSIKPDVFFMPEHAYVDSSNDPVMDELCEASCSQHFYQAFYAGITESAQLARILADEPIWYDRQRTRLLESHDYDRIASLRPNLVRPIAVLISTIPGIPFLQAGQEIGAKNKFCSGSAASAAVDWANGDNDLRDFYKKMLAIRNGSKALKYGDFKDVWSSGDKIFAYSRTYEDERVVIVISFVGRATLSTLDVPFASNELLTDELSGESFPVLEPARFEISVPAFGSRILRVH